MASLETQHLSILVSGGVDASPTVMSLKLDSNENHRTLPCLPSYSILSSGRFVIDLSNEVTVWHVRHRKTRMEDHFEDDSIKVVARIALKGEENVTDASITSGPRKLLAVSSMSGTKVFRLRADAAGNKVKISKISLPESVARNSARKTLFSPDGRWLLIINDLNQPVIYQVRENHGFREEAKGMSMLDSGIRLKSRSKLSKDRIQANEGLCQYTDRIERVAFSPDSKILVLGRLSGQLQTWLLKAPENVVNGNGFTKSSRSSQMSDDSSSDSIEEDSTLKRMTQMRWESISSENELPRLQSNPIVLSFCPSPYRRKSDNTVNGKAENKMDELLVITAMHEILLFRALTGKLTSWSRRNPPIVHSYQLRAQLDRALGCVWDVDPVSFTSRKRIWIYSSTFLAMVDLNRDFPLLGDEEQEGRYLQRQTGGPKKRKREEEWQDIVQRHKHTTGAGGKRPTHQVDSSLDHILEVNGASTSMPEDGFQPLTKDVLTSLDFDERRSHMSALDLVRRRRATLESEDEDDVIVNGDLKDGKESSAVTRRIRRASETPAPNCVIYNKYRNVMGIVPLDSEGGSAETLEVALIECPTKGAGQSDTLQRRHD